MKIDILHFIEGAKKAKGLTVIIDVFRAFSVACYVMQKGAKKIIPVGDIDIAYGLRNKNPDYILMGERNERKPPSFDYGNSPTQIININFSGKTIVQTTGAGTQGIVNAVYADEIITGSFVNAQAVINYIINQDPKQVSLVAMGYRGKKMTDEDFLCAQYIMNTIKGIPVNFNEMKTKIKSGSGKRFFIPENQNHAPSSDFELCLNLNAFDFILKTHQYNNELVYLSKPV